MPPLGKQSFHARRKEEGSLNPSLVRGEEEIVSYRLLFLEKSADA